MHTIDFDYIASLKAKLDKPSKGKGCVNIHFDDGNTKKLIFDAIKDIIERDHNK